MRKSLIVAATMVLFTLPFSSWAEDCITNHPACLVCKSQEALLSISKATFNYGMAGLLAAIEAYIESGECILIGEGVLLKVPPERYQNGTICEVRLPYKHKGKHKMWMIASFLNCK